LGGLVSGVSRPALARGYDASGIKALVFDVYGTCTNYWGTITGEGQVLNRSKGLDVDWGGVATDWHGLYPPGFAAVRDGQRPWQSFASLRREALDDVVRQRGIQGFSDAELAEINAVWQRVEPWPDTLPGLLRLKRGYTLVTLSNADMADMVKLAKRRDLPWDVILTAELAQAVKPDPRVYRLAPRYLGLRPDEIMMVACHKLDLQGAKGQGFRTAFIPRPLEAGPDARVDTAADPRFDLQATSLLDLADLLAA
jgi:2-haloacid dehalogenase